MLLASRSRPTLNGPFWFCRISSQSTAAKKYFDVISGIQFLNEPLGPAFDMSLVRNFYERAYHDMRKVSSNKAVIHDAFMPYGYWNKIMTSEEGFCNILLDHH